MSRPIVDDFDDDATVSWESTGPQSLATPNSPANLIADDFNDDVTVASNWDTDGMLGQQAGDRDLFDEFDDDPTVGVRYPERQILERGDQAASFEAPKTGSDDRVSGTTLGSPPPSRSEWRPPTRFAAEYLGNSRESTRRRGVLVAVALVVLTVTAAAVAYIILAPLGEAQEPGASAAAPSSALH